MKAIMYTKYGDPEELRLQEVKKPTPAPNQVLIKVHAASVNSWDCDMVRGKPYLTRLISGLFKPKHQILGADIAGRVEAIGSEVKQFKVGDEVLGDISASWGGFAEYVCAKEDLLTLKPSLMKFEDAAAIPQAAVLALQGLHDKRALKKGDKVLINGAGGGVGTFAIQMAKLFGAEVTAVDCTEKLPMLRQIGADHVIDYHQEDFTRTGKCYDLIIDMVANRSIFDCKRALNYKGIYTIIGGNTPTILQAVALGPLISMLDGKEIGILLHKANKNLAYILALYEAGVVIPVIDKLYPLSDTADAVKYLWEGKAQGKLIVTM